MAGLGRAMPGHAMRDAAGQEPPGDGRRRGRDEAIEQDRHTAQSRAKDRTGEGRKLTAAQTTEHLEGIGQGTCVAGEPTVDDRGLAGDPCRIEPGARARPAGTPATEECCGDGGRSGQRASGDEQGPATNKIKGHTA